VRLRSRDGLRLSARWLPATEPKGRKTKAPWRTDPHEAIVLLHGWSGSVAPDIVEYAPFLRATAGVLALDFRGHGESDDAPTTWGMDEVEDVAGALAWLGERGVERVALFGTSMGGITAIASVGVLGDGTLAAADMDVDAPAGVVPGTAPADRRGRRGLRATRTRGGRGIAPAGSARSRRGGSPVQWRRPDLAVIPETEPIRVVISWSRCRCC
jgi:pimeloyl-ACP methyl ester carboxylesterase